jgi:hypothetical protein
MAGITQLTHWTKIEERRNNVVYVAQVVGPFVMGFTHGVVLLVEPF